MNTAVRTILAALIFSFCIAGPAQAISPLLKEFEDAFIHLGEIVTPSVVEISAETVAPVSEDRSLNDLFQFGPPDPQPDPREQPHPDLEQPPGPQQRLPRQSPRRMPSPSPRSSTGSGFVYDLTGHIITNNHVVEGATTLRVHFSDGTERTAHVVGQDPSSDLAVIKLDPEGLDLSPVTLSESDIIKVGQFAIAVGSPRGLTGSLSFGHVSALGRVDLNLPTRLRFQGFIQTDAAINLGNSGGPLCDLDGNVIGVNVAIAYGANSIGFAIPVSRVKQVVPQLIATGEVVRGWLGVSIWNIDQAAEIADQEVQDYIEAYGLASEDGVWVDVVNPEGPAHVAGLLVEDVILKIDGVAVKNTFDLIDRISDTKPGTTVILNVQRAGNPVDIPAVLAAWQGRDFATYGRDYFGMYVEEITLDSVGAKMYGMEEGRVVTRIATLLPDGPAMRARLRRYDVILQVAHEDVTDKASLVATLKEKVRPGKSVLINVVRPGMNGNSERVNCFPKIPEDFAIE